MDDQLVRNDTTYISTSLAADLTSYSQDYVGQLARDGHIESVKVGHKRFVGRDDVISYALESKPDLSIQDIPENHRPDQEETDEPEDDEKSGESSDLDGSDNQQIDPDEPEAEAIVIPDDQKSDEQPTARGHQISETSQLDHESDANQGVAISDRANSRWQKSKDGHRQHAEAAVPVESERHVPMLIAALLAVVVSFGLWVGPLSDADETVGTVAHNISVASQSAYTALGYGLDQQLQAHGPAGTVTNSVQETAQLAIAPFLSADSNQSVDAGGAQQVAAAGSTARSFTASLRAFGQSIAGGTDWLIQPITFNEWSFRDYYQQPNRIAVEASIDTSAQDQLDSSYSPEDTQVDQSERGAVVVPAPSSTEARVRKREQIQQQFSDPVEITASTSNSGVVEPRFGGRTGDQYMYVMVPTDEDAATSTRPQE